MLQEPVSLGFIFTTIAVILAVTAVCIVLIKLKK
jgi:hypothetical protein